MKTRFILISLFIVSVCSACNTDGESLSSSSGIVVDTTLTSFPTAEGYGRYSKGGRGGEVVYVTNLNDSGSGSFRDAVTRSGKRTIVFAVSGILPLRSLIVIDDPYLTIAGQTAPGNGITLRNSGIYIKTHDVVIRHIRIRPGDTAEGHRYDDRDALTIGQDSYNIMIDHVSASWAVDEIFSTYYEPQFITFQWCIVSESLSNSKHPEGEHSKGLLVGDNTQKVSVHHNVFAHNNDRSPVQVKGGSSCDVVNNLIYDWGAYAFSFAINYVRKGVAINVMNNYFKTGPSTTGDFFSEPDFWLDSRVYIADNNGDDPLLLDFNRNWQSFVDAKEYLVPSPVDWEKNVLVQDISTDRSSLLSNAGATLPVRDEVDARVISEVISGTGSIIDSQEDVGGYPDWISVVMSDAELLRIDSDKDGMTNAWETVHGLNPENASDRNEDSDGDGYTNLEEYLNGE